MKTSKLLIIPLILALTACTLQITVVQTPTTGPTLPPVIPTSTPTFVVFATQPASPTGPVDMPSPTLVLPLPTEVPGSSPTPVPTGPNEQLVKIFLIALDDNGQSGPLVGCGDSAIPINVVIPKTTGVLRAALEALLSQKAQYYGESGLYNALYQSDLQVADVTIAGDKATIHLTGTLMLGGTCDAPRVEAQIEQTALQFSTVREVVVFLNDVPLKDALSQK